MIISIVLVSVLLLCAIYGLLNRTSSRAMRWFFVILSAIGIIFVLAPDTTTVIAHALGVGRGADLVLYCWVALSFGLFMQQSFALRRTEEQVTEVARAIALAAPRHPDRTSPPPVERQ